jgi:hypothetical protein
MDMRDYRLTAMQSDRIVERDSENEIDDRSRRESEGLELKEYAHCGQVAGLATAKATTGYGEIDGGGDFVSFEQTTFQGSAPPRA